MEYCCHVLADAPSCYLDMLNNSKKRLCCTAGPSLAASLRPLNQRRNVASKQFFYRHHFGRCSSELTKMVPLPYSHAKSPRYSSRLHDFLVTITWCFKNGYDNSFFPRTASLWNFLPAESFPLAYAINGIKSRVKRHLLLLRSF